jgi:UDP-N-acetylmuramoylalanine--D-glutamate ligase
MNKDFKNKKIAILGFGIEGQSVTDYLICKTDNIVVLDEKNRSDFDLEVLKSYESRGIEFRWGKIEDLSRFDMVFRSPGINPTSKFLIDAKKKGIEITSATKLFFDLCPAEIIGVTGTKGKGTTSTLIYEMLKEYGEDAYLGGNIGTPPLSFLDNLDKDSKVVLELSSFQLIDMEKSPHIAVMLMTTSEHLDYHKDVYEYVEAKRNIFRAQTEKDFAIVNQDYPASNESDIITEAKIFKVSRENKVFSEGCFIQDDKIILKYQKSNTKNQILEKEIITISEIKLPGKHNLENVCAAVMIAVLAGVDLPTIKHALKTFKGLPHRIEYVATVRGVRYYDDSFSTTPETAIAAIESFSEPKILLLGGSSKNSDFAELGEVISNSDSIKAIISIGKEWTQIRSKIKDQRSKIEIIEDCKDMEDTVKKASEIAEVGDVVLLSPACASFDRYKNYKQRGEKFKEEVNTLRQ